MNGDSHVCGEYASANVLARETIWNAAMNGKGVKRWLKAAILRNLRDSQAPFKRTLIDDSGKEGPGRCSLNPATGGR